MLAAGRIFRRRLATTVFVDGERVAVAEGASVLDACRAVKREIPTLCHHGRLPPVGSCRVCLVEVNGKLKPSCNTKVTENAKISTGPRGGLHAAHDAVQMQVHDHPWECLSCEVNGDCRLQDLARRLKVDAPERGREQKPLHDLHDWDDDSSNALVREPSKCISCSRCVRACSSLQGMNILGMHGRGSSAFPSPAFDLPLTETECIQCGQCAAVCPTGAIVEKPTWRRVLDDLGSSKGKKVHVAQTAPATRIGIAEEMGFAPGDKAATDGRLAASLRALGFDYVLDTQFAADLTIIEEATELIRRLGLSPKSSLGTEPPSDAEAPENTSLPMATSCCPGWVNYVERVDPSWLPNLSSCRSPQGMLSSLVKNVLAAELGVAPSDVVVTSVMPCTAKKDEAARPQLSGETDRVVSTRELGKMLRARNIRYASLEEEGFDNPFSSSTGASTIFGVSGGVAEAALRTVWWMLTSEPLPELEVTELRGTEPGKLKITSLQVFGKTVRVAVVHGMGNARIFLEALDAARKGRPIPEHIPPEIRDCGLEEIVFFEVMACPGGCIGGGGQPKNDSPTILADRAKAVYRLDDLHRIRESHKNESVAQLYRDHLQYPNSPKAHHLLHTHYTDRTSEVHASGASYTKEQVMQNLEKFHSE